MSISTSPCAAHRAYELMARNPGRPFAYGDFIRHLNLPEGKAIGQRLGERYKADVRDAQRRGEAPYVTRYYVEPRRGAVAEVRFFMTPSNARRYREDKKAQRCAKVAA